MSFRRHSTFLGKLEAVLPWIVLGLLVAVLGGGFAWWYWVKRPAAAMAAAVIRVEDPEMQKLQEESRTLERRFLQVRELGTPGAAEVAGLERAIELHRRWMKATGRSDTAAAARLEELLVARDRERGRDVAAESREAERRAREALAAGRAEEAIALLDRALKAQLSLNALPAATGWRDLSRESQLGQELEQLRVKPLVTDLAVRRAAAQEALARRDWVVARATFQAVRELQLRINREFPRTPHADIAALESIDAEIESLRSADLMTEIEQTVARAEAAERADIFDDAAAEFARAAELQLRINRDFARGRFASSERLDGFETSRQTALSRSLGGELEKLDREISAALRSGAVAEVPARAAHALGLADQMLARFPRSRLVDGPQRRKFSYLSLLGPELERVVGLTRDRFVALPAAGPVKWFAIEVPQELYTRVMNSNPSRNAGPTLPVESLPLADAEECCRRLSWVLGRNVRLPTEAEFRAAVAQLGAATLASKAWTSDAGATKSRAAEAAAGAGEIRDLLGNVAEWLASADDKSSDAAVAGGSYQDTRDAVAAAPVTRVARTERSRSIGFRPVLTD